MLSISSDSDHCQGIRSRDQLGEGITDTHTHSALTNSQFVLPLPSILEVYYIFPGAAVDSYCGPRGVADQAPVKEVSASSSPCQAVAAAAHRRQGGTREQTEVNTITFYRHARWHRTPPLPPCAPADGSQVPSRAHDTVAFIFSIFHHHSSSHNQLVNAMHVLNIQNSTSRRTQF